MRYNLVVIRNNGEQFNVLDFNQFKPYTNYNPHSLIDIYRFTTNYKCTEELINWLIVLGLIPNDFLDSTIKVKNDAGEELEVIYSYQKPLFNLNNLINSYMLNCNNKELYKILLEKFRYLENYEVFYEIILEFKDALKRLEDKKTCADEIKKYLMKFIRYYLKFDDEKEKISTLNNDLWFFKLSELITVAIQANCTKLLKTSDKKDSNKMFYTESDIEKERAKDFEVIERIKNEQLQKKEKITSKVDYLNTIEGIKAQLKHYRHLLRTCVLEEEKQAYQQEIDNLIRKMWEKNGTTRH